MRSIKPVVRATQCPNACRADRKECVRKSVFERTGIYRIPPLSQRTRRDPLRSRRAETVPEGMRLLSELSRTKFLTSLNFAYIVTTPNEPGRTDICDDCVRPFLRDTLIGIVRKSRADLAH